MPGPEVNPDTILTLEGRALYNWRVMKDVPQSEVARAAGIHHSSYNRLEQGVRKPGKKIQTQLSKAFGRPYEEIIQEQERLEGHGVWGIVSQLEAENGALRVKVHILYEYIGLNDPQSAS